MFRPIKIRHYVSFMAARGHAADAVLEGSGIAAAQLGAADCLVDYDQVQTVVANMIRLTGQQGIGLEVGLASELTDFGVVGHAMMSSKTARDAVELWLRYSNALVGMLISLRLEEHDGEAWSLTLAEMRPLGFLYNFGVEEILAIAVKMGGQVTRQPVVPSSVELSYPAPAHQAHYAALLGCEPRFNCRRTVIRFDTPPLSLPLKGGDEEFNAICLQHCSQLMKRIAGVTPLVSRIHSLLLSRMRGIPTLEELAGELGMSPRSLRRHLLAEGCSYRELIHDFRVDLAKEYLVSSRMTTKEAAYLLGFQDPNAFRRAFKVWTGLTVHEFIELSSPAPGGSTA